MRNSGIIGVFYRKWELNVTRVRKLYKTWCKENKQYFRKGKLKDECIQDAKNSLMQHLRAHNVTIAEAQFASVETTQLWDIVVYFASYLIGAITGSIAMPQYDFWTGVIWGLIGLVILFHPLKFVVWKYTHDINMSANTLLQMTLESYQQIYSSDMCRDTKECILFHGKTVTIPYHAEELYEQKMRNSKYYRNAYLVSIHTRNQEFEYIWYTNTSYKKFNPHAHQKFLDTCEEQIGMKWAHIDKTQIAIKDLSHPKTSTSN